MDSEQTKSSQTKDPFDSSYFFNKEALVKVCCGMPVAVNANAIIRTCSKERLLKLTDSPHTPRSYAAKCCLLEKDSDVSIPRIHPYEFTVKQSGWLSKAVLGSPEKPYSCHGLQP